VLRGGKSRGMVGCARTAQRMLSLRSEIAKKARPHAGRGATAADSVNLLIAVSYKTYFGHIDCFSIARGAEGSVRGRNEHNPQSNPLPSSPRPS
jgi:hypothetical protein